MIEYRTRLVWLTRLAANFIICISIGLSSVTASEEALQPLVTELRNNSPNNILFVGNSYLYYNDSLHNHVYRIVTSIRPDWADDIAYKSATIGGASLSHHNIDSYLEPGKLGLDIPFDLVILQGGSGESLRMKRQIQFSEKVVELQTKISMAGAETALYMTHAYVPPHRRYDPQMIRDIETLYVETGNEVGALVIPVGLAFEEAYRRRPNIILHKTFDGSHPDMLGTYLAACVVFASIYGLSPVGSSYDYFGEVSDEDASFLQLVAWDTVSKFFRTDNY